MKWTCIALGILALEHGLMAQPEESSNLGAIPAVDFQQLSDPYVSNLGRHALSIRPDGWSHGETENFIYHFFNSFIATPVSVEAEFYYHFMANDLGKDDARWERKGHIFIFEELADWRAFQTQAQLDPWTGGIHSNNELFILRDRSQRWKGHLLAHETAHLVIDRFFGGTNVPLWLNEGYAEYAGVRAHAAFWRARNYMARPRSRSVDPERFIPLLDLTSMRSYPTDLEMIGDFYIQSERLVRFLNATDSKKFPDFLQQMASGKRFDTALTSAYRSNWQIMAQFEREFRPYASKDFVPSSSE